MEPHAQPTLNVDAGRREVIFTGVLAAPRDLVFAVYTDPQLVPQWWGPRNLTTTVMQMDVRPGGAWRFVQRDAAGQEYAFHGVYRQVTPFEQLAYTFEFEGMPGHKLLETVTFAEQEGRTVLTVRDTFQTVADLEGMLQAGMEAGSLETYERLNELLQALLNESSQGE